MGTRILSEAALANKEIELLLNKLVDRSTNHADYRKTMFELGGHLGEDISRSLPQARPKIMVACTVEDADDLARGIIFKLAMKEADISFACFWNERFSPFGFPELKVAPILREYVEPTQHVDYLVIVKSIISGGCVVKTNLYRLFEQLTAENILVCAPVIFDGSERQLEREFDAAIAKKFSFIYFAKDAERLDNGEVVPGIGGEIYSRAGFGSQESKNRHTPSIVKQRREEYRAKAA